MKDYSVSEFNPTHSPTPIRPTSMPSFSPEPVVNKLSDQYGQQKPVESPSMNLPEQLPATGTEMFMSKDQFMQKKDRAVAQGLDPRILLDRMVQKGYTIEGWNDGTNPSYDSMSQKETEQAVDPLGALKGVPGKVGQEGDEWNDNLLGRVDPRMKHDSDDNILQTGVKAGANVIPSTINIASDIGNMALNPIDTAEGLLRIVSGVGSNATRRGISKVTGQSKEEVDAVLQEAMKQDNNLGKIARILNENDELADQVGVALKDQYGSGEAIQKTIAEDPMTVISDLAGLVAGGSSLVKKGAQVGGKASLAKKAGDIVDVANKVDPYNVVAGGMMEGGKKVVGAGVDVTKAGAGKVRDSFKWLTEDGRTADQLTQQITQAPKLKSKTAKDRELADAQEVLQQLDADGIKTYEDGLDQVNTRIKSMVEEQNRVLDGDQEKFMPHELDKKFDVDGEKATINSMKDALDDLEELYEGTMETSKDTGNPRYLEIKALKKKFENEGLTGKEINDVAREYNKAFDNLRNKKGELKESKMAQRGENTRSELKSRVQEKYPTVKKLDKEMSKHYTVKKHFEAMSQKVAETRGRAEFRTRMKKFGRGVAKAVDMATLGLAGSLVTGLLKGNVGNKILNNIGVEEALSSNIKKLQERFGKVDGILEDLESGKISKDEAIKKLKALPMSKVEITPEGVVKGKANKPEPTVEGKKDIVETGQKNVKKPGSSKMEAIKRAQDKKKQDIQAKKDKKVADQKKKSDDFDAMKGDRVSLKDAKKGDTVKGKTGDGRVVIGKVTDTGFDRGRPFVKVDGKTVKTGEAVKAPKAKLKVPEKKKTAGMDLKKLSQENRKTLPKVRSSNVFKKDVEQPKSKDYLDLDEKALGNGTEKVLNTDELIPTQKNLNIENLEGVSKAGDLDKIDVWEEGGKFYIIDGHHRAGVETLKGGKTIVANVVNGSKKTPTKKANIDEVLDQMEKPENKKKYLKKTIAEDQNRLIEMRGDKTITPGMIAKKERAINRMNNQLKEIKRMDAEEQAMKEIDREIGSEISPEARIKLGKATAEIIDESKDYKDYLDDLQNSRTDKDEVSIVAEIQKIEAMEQRIGKVGKNKIGKGTDWKAHQKKMRESGKERLIEKIGEKYNLDASDAKDMYDELNNKSSRDLRDFKYQRQAQTEGYSPIDKKEATSIVRKYFTEDELPVHFVDNIQTPGGQKALGYYHKQAISMVKNPDKTTPSHEVLHAYFDMFTDKKRQRDVLDQIKKEKGIKDDLVAEEALADGFAEFVKDSGKFSGKVKKFFGDIRDSMKSVFGKGDKVRKLFRDIEKKKRGDYFLRQSKKKFQVPGKKVALRKGEFDISGTSVPKVARERFDFTKLKKISFGGSDRDVYDMGDGKVLKVAKTARGLRQNEYADWYLSESGIIPEVLERGDNYTVFEKVTSYGDMSKAQLTEVRKFSDKIKDLAHGLTDYRGAVNRDKMDKMRDHLYEIGWEDLTNYDLSNFGRNDIAPRNLGFRGDKIVLLDEGSIELTSTIEEFKGVKNMDDPDFRDIYKRSKEAKKVFGDNDDKTMY